MHTDMEARACDLAEYLLANNATVRAAAKQFGQQVRQLLDRNKAERHIRGGMATRRKYKGT